ncbi:MAG: RES family NAD+ phosphorylase [Candidatus Brevundimonas phytovorans]|nr:RES family NAD+ phosphorylase [Brevundimonas sp.]WEK58872.1 MAG: RES family NAD+ phosphorylase [Brevundimonas sp.]
MEADGVQASCDYCQQIEPTLTIGEIADRVAAIFDAHFVRSSSRPDAFQTAMLMDRESDYEWERSGEPVAYVIAEILRSEPEPANDLQAVLEDRHSTWDDQDETEFDGDSHYVQKRIDDSEWQIAWDRFETELKTETRLLTRTGLTRLEAVFGGLEDLRTWRNGALIVEAGPGSPYATAYRARAFQSEDKLEEALVRPDLHLGPPPQRLAAAGRMNFQNIAAFYGATDVETALAEVRPPVGSHVAVVQFDISRPLRLLDLTAVTATAAHGSYFDSGYVEFSRRVKFLKRLAERMTLPVMPDDVLSEYLPTQTIANYLEHILEPPLDGIIFPSSQVETSSGLNIVLFRKAARVESLSPTDGVELALRRGEWFGDEWEQGYTVVERRAASTTRPAEVEEENWPSGPPTTPDERPVTLRVNTETLAVHKVQWVKVRAPGRRVYRTRAG